MLPLLPDAWGGVGGIHARCGGAPAMVRSREAEQGGAPASPIISQSATPWVFRSKPGRSRTTTRDDEWQAEQAHQSHSHRRPWMRQERVMQTHHRRRAQVQPLLPRRHHRRIRGDEHPANGGKLRMGALSGGGVRGVQTRGAAVRSGMVPHRRGRWGGRRPGRTRRRDVLATQGGHAETQRTRKDRLPQTRRRVLGDSNLGRPKPSFAQPSAQLRAGDVRQVAVVRTRGGLRRRRHGGVHREGGEEQARDQKRGAEILLQSNRRRPDRRAVQAIKGGHLDATQYGLAVHLKKIIN